MKLKLSSLVQFFLARNSLISNYSTLRKREKSSFKNMCCVKWRKGRLRRVK